MQNFIGGNPVLIMLINLLFSSQRILFEINIPLFFRIKGKGRKLRLSSPSHPTKSYLFASPVSFFPHFFSPFLTFSPSLPSLLSFFFSSLLLYSAVLFCSVLLFRLLISSHFLSTLPSSLLSISSSLLITSLPSPLLLFLSLLPFSTLLFSSALFCFLPLICSLLLFSPSHLLSSPVFSLSSALFFCSLPLICSLLLFSPSHLLSSPVFSLSSALFFSSLPLICSLLLFFSSLVRVT